MRVTFPHLGKLYIFWRALCRGLGLEAVPPPFSSQRTLDLGVRHCPEMTCAPCKLIFGNYVEALETAPGADAVLFFGGYDACRLGYSMPWQAQLLREMGREFRAYSFNLRALREDLVARLRDLAAVNDASPLDTLEAVRCAFTKLRLTDAAERQAQWLRPREVTPGATNQALREALARIDALPDRAAVESQAEPILSRFDDIDRDEDRPVVRVGIVGDPYTMLEPFFNRGLEEELGRRGVEVHRWLYIGDLTRWDILAGLSPNPHGEPVREAAQAFVGQDIGGFGRLTVGHAVLFARAGFDGLVHLAPFECLPEVVAHNVLRPLQEDIPILSLSFDEQTARAGLVTRLEAFADVLHMRRAAHDHR